MPRTASDDPLRRVETWWIPRPRPGPPTGHPSVRPWIHLVLGQVGRGVTGGCRAFLGSWLRGGGARRRGRHPCRSRGPDAGENSVRDVRTILVVLHLPCQSPPRLAPHDIGQGGRTWVVQPQRAGRSGKSPQVMPAAGRSTGSYADPTAASEAPGTALQGRPPRHRMCWRRNWRSAGAPSCRTSRYSGSRDRRQGRRSQEEVTSLQGGYRSPSPASPTTELLGQAAAPPWPRRGLDIGEAGPNPAHGRSGRRDEPFPGTPGGRPPGRRSSTLKPSRAQEQSTVSRRGRSGSALEITPTPIKAAEKRLVLPLPAVLVSQAVRRLPGLGHPWRIAPTRFPVAEAMDSA